MAWETALSRSLFRLFWSEIDRREGIIELSRMDGQPIDELKFEYHFRAARKTAKIKDFTSHHMLSGSTYVELKGYTNDVRGLFETVGAKEAREIFYEKAREAEAKNSGMLQTLENAALKWQSHEETFPMLLGYILGLRIPGMSSEQTKAMAHTWRLGYPQDDRD